MGFLEKYGWDYAFYLGTNASTFHNTKVNYPKGGESVQHWSALDAEITPGTVEKSVPAEGISDHRMLAAAKVIAPGYTLTEQDRQDILNIRDYAIMETNEVTTSRDLAYLAAKESIRGIEFPDPPPIDHNSALAWAVAHNVNVHKKFIPQVRMDDIHQINTDIARMPSGILYAIDKLGGKLEVIYGNGVADHPDLVEFKGKKIPIAKYEESKNQPASHTKNDTYDTLPAAASGKKAYVVANKMEKGKDHLSVNPSGHELFHVAHLNLGRPDVSDEWLAIHWSEKWPSIEQNTFPWESWTEGLNRFSASKESRKDVPIRAQNYFRKYALQKQKQMENDAKLGD